MKPTLHFSPQGDKPGTKVGWPKAASGASRAALLLAGWLGLAGSSTALAQTCGQNVHFDYTNVGAGTRQTGSDNLSGSSPGTTLTYSAYSGSTPAATNTFSVGTETILGPSPSQFLVWKRNVTGGGPTSDIAYVTFTFSRPVSNLKFQVTDIDKDLSGGTANFIDRLTLNGYDAATGGNLITLTSGNVSGPGIANASAKFVGAGSTATATSDPAAKANAITGITTSSSTATGDVIISFPSPVQRVELAYENIAPFVASTTDRTHTIGFEFIDFCAQADVYTAYTAGPTSALPGATVNYTVQFGNNGPENSASTTRTVTIPTGATVTSTGGGTLTGNTLDFGTLVENSGSQTSFTYSYKLPATAGVFYAPNFASTTTGANQISSTLTNDNASRTLIVVPVTDLATTISGPAAATAGNLITLDVTTSNNGPASTANVAQTVQLPAGLGTVFVSNNGTYDTNTGTVTFPTLATLGNGQTVANTISFVAPTTAFAPVATVSTNPTGESNTTNNTAYLNQATTSTSLTINAVAGATVANLYTTISASALTVATGTSETLTVVAANNGPTAAANVVETVQLLPGFTAATLTIGGASSTGSNGNNLLFANGVTYNRVTGLVTFGAIASLASGGSQSYTIQFTAPSNVGGQLLATAAISANSTSAASVTIDPVPADNVASTKITILPATDLVASIAANSTTLYPNQSLSYDVTVTNNGPAIANNVTSTVQLPAGLSGVTLSEGTYNSATGLVTFPTIASSAAGVSQYYSISYTPPTTGSYPATVTTSSSTPETVPGNNSATTTTTVSPQTDLSVAINGPANAATGGAVTYVIQSTNNGPSAAGTVTTTVVLPPGTLNPTLPANATYAAATRTVTFTDNNVANGATVSNYVTFANPNTIITSSYQVTATVSSSATDPNAGNNTATSSPTTTVLSGGTANGSTAFTTVPASAAPGAPISLTFNYKSNGILALDGVLERLYLPPGTAVTSRPTGSSYDPATGILTLPGITLSRTGSGATDTYTVVVTAPTAGTQFTAVSSLSSSQAEATYSDNVAAATVTITQPAAPTTFDEITSISGPATALPGTLVTYTVQAINNGPGVTANATTQTVTLPAGLVPSTISNGGVYSSTNNTITWTSPAGQAVGAGGIVTNTFTVAMPASGSLSLSARVAVTGETNNGNNTSALTTTQANQLPIAASVVNALQGPEGNTAGPLPISPLVATDVDGSISYYTLLSLPDATTQGTLYYNNNGTFTALTTANVGSVTLTATQAQTLRFDPVAALVGNVSFTYAAYDNLRTSSLPALYTIQVAQDYNAQYITTAPKGGGANYIQGDIIAYATDVNGAVYNSAGQIYSATGELQTGAANGLATTGTNAVLVANAGPGGNAANTLPRGVSINPSTGQIFVSDVSPTTGLVNSTTSQTYSVNVTTTDIYGGVTTQLVSFTIGANPLPVVLTAFTAQAIQNRDALLTWATASELNSAFFEVERSLDGVSFVKIGEKAAQGTKASASGYTFTDASIGTRAQGVVYYRLRQVDFDAKATYSPVRTVAFGPTVTMSLYPNPAQTSTKLDLSQLPATASYQVLVVDVMGKQVFGTKLSGGTAQPLEITNLATGTYHVLVTGTSADGTLLRRTLHLVKE